LIHAKQLFRFALKLCADYSRAEDLVQETLLSAWSNFHQLEFGTNCRAWLFRILVNLRNKEFSKRGPSRKPISLEQQQVTLSASETLSNAIRSQDSV
jgi:RNA polymerase sigma-70 factor, ECF subfamily